ncbi:MAG: peroxiredoxin [Betaproteobacteria bacterium HGW-Betaproteobacteria-11]|nr:MAG: peroxiredoxin [Betaproteobacteria bacterium HGW-Betaproteobacteria-11]
MSDVVTITVTQQENYKFLVDFGSGLSPLLADEPEPLGGGEGPDPSRILLAAVANCLAASLLFALKKFKQDAGRITATATATTGRNENNRLRITQIDVSLNFSRPGAAIEHLDRIIGQFDEFCTVSQSVRQGIPLRIEVKDGDGRSLK